MIIIRLNTHSGVPPYLQIVQQVKHAIRVGFLKEGDKLPTVKEVVTMTAINPNTVFKAYRELERRGFVQGRAGIGTFVLRQPPGPRPSTQIALAKSLALWIREAGEKGLDQESIEALFHATLHNIRKEQHETNSCTDRWPR